MRLRYVASRIQGNSLALGKQLGIGLPAAIFIITIMALIAVAINRLVEQNSQSFAEQANLARAFYAAETGAGFFMNGLFPPEDYPTYSSFPADCSVAWGTRVYNFSIEGLNGCSASVQCSSVLSPGTETFVTVESTGTCDVISRTVQVRTSF